MIPQNHLNEWAADRAPWQSLAQIEQDLLISRAMVDLFSDFVIEENVAMRGGTCIHKLFFETAYRYSEDIDLVLLDNDKEAIIWDKIKDILSNFLEYSDDESSRAKNPATLVFLFSPEDEQVTGPKNIEVQINTTSETPPFREIVPVQYSIENSWYSQSRSIQTYEIEELLGTKMRALHERNKGRDLFDIWLCLKEIQPDASLVTEAFKYYMVRDSGFECPTQADFEAMLTGKIIDHYFMNDMNNLIRPSIEYSPREAMKMFWETLVKQLEGSRNEEKFHLLEKYFNGSHPVID